MFTTTSHSSARPGVLSVGLVALLTLGCASDITLEEVKLEETGVLEDFFCDDNFEVWEEVADETHCDFINTDEHFGLTGPNGPVVAKKIDSILVTGSGADSEQSFYVERLVDGTSPSTFITDQVESNHLSPTWTWKAEEADLGYVNDVPRDVWWRTTIRTLDGMGSDLACAQYFPLEACFETSFTDSAKRASIDSTCYDGAGDFLLVPVVLRDKDLDDDLSVVFQAVQISGTGTLTDAAWIREITATETHGATLRVAKVDVPYHFLGNDLLADASAMSYSVSGSGSNFASGLVSGAAPFIVEEADGAADADFSVAMEWECATPSEWKTPPVGYVLSTSSLDDCVDDIPQKFVLRPRVVEGEPVRLAIMPYGQLGRAKHVEVTKVGYDFEFDYSFLDFHVSGTIGSFDAEEMEITIDAITWDSVALCDPGPYTLPASE